MIKKATKKKTKTKVTAKKAKTTSAKKLDPIKVAQSKLDGVADVLRMSDEDTLFNVRRYVSTRSIALDKLLNWKGVPCGRITEIAGDNHTGKSTLLDQILAQVQAEGGYAVLIDTEQAHDVKYSRTLGIDADKLMVVQPKQHTLEGVILALSRVLTMFETDFPKMSPIVIGVDSVAGIPTEADRASASEDGKQKPGDAAKQIHNLCRIVGSKIASKQIALIFTNQLYTSIGGPFAYKKSYGGEAIPYHASLRLKTAKVETLKGTGGIIIGQKVKVQIVKSKLSDIPSQSSAEMAILHGVGVDNCWTIFEAFKRAGYISTSGAWSTMHLSDEETPRKWNGGHAGLAALCKDDPTLMPKLTAIYASMGG